MKQWMVIYAILVGWAAGCLKCYSRCSTHMSASECSRMCGCSQEKLATPVNYFLTEDGAGFLVQPGCRNDCKVTCFSLSQGWTLHQCLTSCECDLQRIDLENSQQEAELIAIQALSAQSQPFPPANTPVSDSSCEEKTAREQSQEEACYVNCQNSCSSEECVATCSDHFCGGYSPPQVTTSNLSFWLLLIGVLVGLLLWGWYQPKEESRRPLARRVRLSP
jgi:hypothetical protein